MKPINSKNRTAPAVKFQVEAAITRRSPHRSVLVGLSHTVLRYIIALSFTYQQLYNSTRMQHMERITLPPTYKYQNSWTIRGLANG